MKKILFLICLVLSNLSYSAVAARGGSVRSGGIKSSGGIHPVMYPVFLGGDTAVKKSNTPEFKDLKGVIECYASYKSMGGGYVYYGCDEQNIQQYFESHKPEKENQIISVMLDTNTYNFYIYYK